jgi:7-carboxy-7-deazaguanine synthase
MTYAVKEVFHTLQGEGANAGRAAVFLRFSGCNLWSGREEDRSSGTGGCAVWCDTDFVGTNGQGGGVFRAADDLARHVAAIWRGGFAHRFVVCTGGEPLLQLDVPLVDALHREGFLVAVETNGTRPPPDGLDWVCVSPKPGGDLCVRTGDELKLVFPQQGVDPGAFEDLDFQYFFLQPRDGPDLQRTTRQVIDYCETHPRWRLSLQVHKLIGIP